MLQVQAVETGKVLPKVGKQIRIVQGRLDIEPKEIIYSLPESRDLVESRKNNQSPTFNEQNVPKVSLTLTDLDGEPIEVWAQVGMQRGIMLP